MKRFLKRIAIYVIVILTITIFLWRWMALQPNRYSLLSHEINLRHQLDRITTIHEPKIIFIGGSGCAFGLCSPMIHEHYQIPVVNTGTHAGLGLRLQIYLFMPYISRNDIVVVIPEYAQFKGNYYWGESTILRIFSSSCYEGYKYLNVRQQLHLFKYVPSAYRYARFARSMQGLSPENPYAAEALNEFGDVERYEFRKHQTMNYGGEDLDKNSFVQDKVIDLLSDFNRYCEEKGATMLLFPPTYRDVAFEKNADQITEIWEALSAHNLPIISSPENYEFPDSLFFDSDYHLTYEGVVVRTNKLISDLDPLHLIP